jgi:hypothetical protein
MRSAFVAGLLLAALLPTPALAQSGAAGSAGSAPSEDRPAAKLREVERGLSVGVEGGGLLFFKPKGTDSGLSFGRSLGISLGVDLSEAFSLGVVAMGINVDAPSDLQGTGSAQPPRKGDFTPFIFGGELKVALLAQPDPNGVKRLFVYLKGGAGTAFISPKDFYPGNDVVAFAGGGIEYFTHLRHFSIGIEADLIMGFNYLGAGTMVSPSLRYTF